MKSDRKRTILFIIILLVLSMGIGYAFLTTTLTIDGVSDIDSASWDVHFENVQVMNISVTGSQVITPATIGNNGTTVSYHIKLNNPGEVYVFKVDTVNAGTLNAKIDNIIIKLNDETNYTIPNYLQFALAYDSEHYPLKNVAVGDYLLPGQTRRMLFGIGYNPDIIPSDLPTENQEINLKIEIVYSQIPSMQGFYLASIFEAFMFSYDDLPNGVVTYDSYQSAVSNFGYPFFIRIVPFDDSSFEASVGFVYNGQDYYLIGADNGDAFESNKALLNSLIGEDNCYTEDDEYICHDSGNGIYYNVSDDGEITIHKDNMDLGCKVDSTELHSVYTHCGSVID